MNVVLCLDNNNGLLFNHRRQSRDRILIDNLLSLVEQRPLYINSFSEILFAESIAIVNEDFLELAGIGTFCFVENSHLSQYLDKVEKIIIYRWNRDYPADFYFDVDLSSWYCIEQIDFAGSSHEKITREIYRRI